MNSLAPVLITVLIFGASNIAMAEQPCDRYSIGKQKRCETLWKQINDEAVTEMAQFGTNQLKRREEGKITA
ncbi:MAG: hypothetical protein ACREJU_10935, partial [Nitrospiraceae bacterium]